jgi:hypothetical protein
MAADDIAVYSVALTAATEDTVTFARDCDYVRVYNDTGTAAIHFTVNNTAATVGGSKTYRVAAAAGAYKDVSVPGAGNTTVRLISSGTPTYSVEGSI